MPATGIDSIRNASGTTFFCALCGRGFFSSGRQLRVARQNRNTHEQACNGDSHPSEQGREPGGPRISYPRLTDGFR